MFTPNLKRILQNTSWLTLAEGVSMLIMFGVTVLAARIFGKVGFGQFSFVLYYVFLFGAFLDFGLGMLFLRDTISEPQKQKQYFNLILGQRLVAGVLLFGIIIFSGKLISPSANLGLLFFLALQLIIDSVNAVGKVVFRFEQKMQYEACFKIFNRIVLGIGAIMIFFWAPTLLNLGIVFFSASLLEFILIFVFVRRFGFTWRPHFSFNFLREVFPAAWPIMLSSLLAGIYYRVDMTMLEMMQGSAVVGIYSGAYTFFSGLTMLPAMIVVAVWPVLAKFFKEEKENFYISAWRLIKNSFLGGIVILLGVLLIGSKIAVFFLGQSYIESGKVLNILAGALVFNFPAQFLMMSLIIAHHQRLLLLVTFFGVLFNIILNLFWIPLFSYNGAAWATLLTEGLVVILALGIFFYSQRKNLSHVA